MIIPTLRLTPLGDPSPEGISLKVILSQGGVLQSQKRKTRGLNFLENDGGWKMREVHTNRSFKFDVYKSKWF